MVDPESFLHHHRRGVNGKPFSSPFKIFVPGKSKIVGVTRVVNRDSLQNLPQNLFAAVPSAALWELPSAECFRTLSPGFCSDSGLGGTGFAYKRVLSSQQTSPVRSRSAPANPPSPRRRDGRNVPLRSRLYRLHPHW